MKTVQRIASIALALPLALGGAAVLAMPANAAPDNKTSQSQSVESKAKGQAKAAEAQAKSAEFKALISAKVADQKSAVDSAQTKEEWKEVIQDWLDVNRRGIAPEPVVVQPPVLLPPIEGGVTGPIEGSPTRPPLVVGG